jgi:hypothetical protein
MLDAHSLLVLAVGPIIGWVMIQAGVFKQMLDRKQDDRTCPSCGRHTSVCGC